MVEFDKKDSVLLKGDDELIKKMLDDLLKKGKGIKAYDRIEKGQYGIVRADGKRSFRTLAKEWADENGFKFDIKRETLTISDYRGLFDRCYIITAEETYHTLAFIGFGWGDKKLIETLGGKKIAEKNYSWNDVIIAKTKESPLEFCKKYFDEYTKDMIEGFKQDAIAEGENPNDAYEISYSKSAEGEGWLLDGPECVDVLVLDRNNEDIEEYVDENILEYVVDFNIDGILSFHED